MTAHHPLAVVGRFDRASQAQIAVQQLVNAGVRQRNISFMTRPNEATGGTLVLIHADKESAPRIEEVLSRNGAAGVEERLDE